PSTAHIDAAVLKRRSTFERPTTPIGRSLSWGVNTRSTCRSRCVITLSETSDGLWTPFPKSSHLQLSSWLSQLATSSISSGRSNGRSFIAVPIFLLAPAGREHVGWQRARQGVAQARRCHFGFREWRVRAGDGNAVEIPTRHADHGAFPQCTQRM